MKQRIAVEDLNQLTYEQQNKLRQLWLPRIGNAVNYKYDNEVMFININAGDYNIILIRGNDKIRVAKEDCLPLLNIGQLIELILDNEVKNNYPEFDGFLTRITKDTCNEMWKLVINLL